MWLRGLRIHRLLDTRGRLEEGKMGQVKREIALFHRGIMVEVAGVEPAWCVSLTVIACFIAGYKNQQHSRIARSVYLR